jgi:hypothetical protein
MKTVVRGNFERHVDFESGEVKTEVEISQVRFPQEPPFVKMYVNDLCSVLGVGNADQSLLRHLLARLDYDGFVVITTRVRESIAGALNINQKTLRNRLNSLVNANLIKPVSRNDYRVNPDFFARGDWKKICEQKLSYSMNITYDSNGRTISTKARGVEEEQLDIFQCATR